MEFHDRLAFGADTTLHFNLLRNNDLSIFVGGANDLAQAVVGNDVINFSAIGALYAGRYADEFWDEPGGGNPPSDMFQFPINIGSVFQIDNVIQYVICDPAQHAAGYIFQNQSTSVGDPMYY